MQYIIHGQLVLENGILWDGALGIKGGRIAWIGKTDAVAASETARAFDAGGLYIGPGFVDIHVHGANERLFYQAPRETAAHFLRHGETTLLPTLYHDLKPFEMAAAIRALRTAAHGGGACAAIAGLYMEGPYLSPRYGGNLENHQWRNGVKPEEYEPVVREAGDFARVWAFAPELEGVEAFVRYVKRINPNAVFAMAHSEATPEEARRFKREGLKIQTHCMNATGRRPTLPGTRSAGPDEACLSDPDLYAELICDSQGIHVCPEIQRMLLRIKGTDRIILITDSMPSANPPKDQHGAFDLSYDANGDLYGSRLTLDQACRNLMAHTPCGITQAFLLAARNPAEAVGLGAEVGTLEIGKRANLVLVDDRFQVHRVLLNGEVVVKNEEERD